MSAVKLLLIVRILNANYRQLKTVKQLRTVAYLRSSLAVINEAIEIVDENTTN